MGDGQTAATSKGSGSNKPPWGLGLVEVKAANGVVVAVGVARNISGLHVARYRRRCSPPKLEDGGPTPSWAGWTISRAG
ncbi:hypothetical protein E2562_014911 [Oryza meyeriana var. granulata]|uniref:Uncharacterized protein n=1 Tax=Oryza meyeriana var. granulata TaxID=110450 RepID=A0A6G1EIA9_9ORYZ|nr:hypothetical protein E2562_014911 [Oryza meyeriana var. granulata]